MKPIGELYAQYNSRRDKIADLDKRIQRLKERREALHSQGWVEMTVVPIAKELAKRMGLHYEIYGPFGLRCETTIYLLKKKERNIVKNDTWSITLTPHGFGGDFYLSYDTGERREYCPAGSIGMLNHFDHVEEPLPDTIEEIIDLLVFAEGEKND